MMHRRTGALLSSAVAACLGTAAAQAADVRGADPLAQIDHILVIYAENRSFDHLYGLFPGANGIANAGPGQVEQRDHDGKVLPHLPPVYENGKPNPRFPNHLPNRPFQINAPPVNGKFDDQLPSPVHSYWQNRDQINGGRNDRYVAMSDTGAWAMGYWDASKLRLWQWAREYTLADNYFMGAYGGSFLNHQWLICACTPRFDDAPASMRPQLDERGELQRKADSPKSVLDGPVQVYDGRVTSDGYAVNTLQPPFQPSGAPPAPGGDLRYADPAKDPLPPQTSRTIGDTLTAKGVTWAWYAGGWNAAVADGERDPTLKRMVIYSRDPGSLRFQAHHQPFNYFQRFAPGSRDREQHLRDSADLLKAIESGSLPQVAFYKPAGAVNQHPSYTDLQSGDAHIADVLEKLRASPQWKHLLVIVTYDENGGFWDHAAPPAGPGWSDRWGPGTRVPALIVSPFAKRGQVDSTPYDTTSILKLITRRFGLEPLPGVRQNVGDFTSALELRP